MFSKLNWSSLVRLAGILLVGGYIVRRLVFPMPDFPAASHLTTLGQADYSWTVHTLDGREVELSEFRGKVLFINVWATWCAPCREEMPSLQKLYTSLRHEPVEFLFLAEEDKATVKNFLASNRYDLPAYLGGGELLQKFEVHAIPTTLIVDPSGDAVFRHEGPARWDNDASRKFIRSLVR